MASPGCARWLRDLAAIQSVLEHIIDGQMLDIRRFPSDGKLRRLANDTELDDYTWLVAGCVGEFWTQLCASELLRLARPSGHDGADADLGARGQGPQLINILRDIGEDTRDGRCYPPCELEQLCRVAALASNPSEHLEGGLRYVQHVSHGKLRYATALPLLLGIQTIAKMRSTAWEQLPRREDPAPSGCREHPRPGDDRVSQSGRRWSGCIGKPGAGKFAVARRGFGAPACCFPCPMKALVLTAPLVSSILTPSFPDPTPAAGEVLVQVKACGICGSDIHGMDGAAVAARCRS